MPKNPYVEFVVEQFQPLGEITSRAMFGGHALYCDGITFALIAGNAVYLKADDLNRPRFQDRGLKPFQPFPDKPGVMQYYESPAEIFEDSDALKVWGKAAVEAGRRAQAAKQAVKQRTKPPAKRPPGRH
jgi:DNA transformation protein